MEDGSRTLAVMALLITMAQATADGSQTV